MYDWAMIEPVPSPYCVPFNGSFDLDAQPTAPPVEVDEKEQKRQLKDYVSQFDDLQRRLYAADTHSVLLVFQALDAAGKDSTIRAVTRGVNPAGFQVSSFKAPSSEERDHDFLWRSARRLPERGRIGVFNRSYYEEVLVVRVHPEYLTGQRVEVPDDLSTLWAHRYASIRDHERHLADNGTLILKFWLNISREEQARRLLRRIDRPDKNWKFEAGDLDERACWDDYMAAFQDALAETSRPWAPWYAIPADNKPFMRQAVAGIIVNALERLNPQFPDPDPEELNEMGRCAAQLRAELEAE
jgi:PPK2 family polyphosphate:nucleotide phosphotransferase